MNAYNTHDTRYDEINTFGYFIDEIIHYQIAHRIYQLWNHKTQI